MRNCQQFPTPKPDIVCLQHSKSCFIFAWEVKDWSKCDCGAIINWYETEIKRLACQPLSKQERQLLAGTL
jgi:hypothetical protein